MRVSKKKKVLQSISVLNRANRKLKLMKYGTANELLAQCQELALAIGNQIEESGEKVTRTIDYLEDYCEMLYKASVCENRTEHSHIVKDIAILLKKIEKSIKEDIENSPYEIVFMPYKASMWDSMDSVFRAAMLDYNCNVIVMPVPYYNINRMREQVEMHYEGNLFSKDIPITDFRKYSLAEVQPDVIIIHNPYDQYNYVTRLPEEYFSSNLVKYTEHLVYIPYFITKGDQIKENYCVLPAVKNAWRTFVQSEAVRKCYIKYGADSNRIITMGSPKLDLVIKMQNNQTVYPDEWKNIIGGRKIFLLNTHLNPIINAAEKLINKLHKIFNLFKQLEEVVLLWRPHPLSIETAKSMNPQILERYLEVIEEFKTLTNGIYDETPDIHRAISISDAYIGDWSSVATLYGVTGKPMFIMNINVDTNVEESEKEKEEKERGISFSSATELDGYLWAPGDDLNGLFRISLENRTSEYITNFSKENIHGKFLYKGIVLFENKLFLIPRTAEHIAEYNIDSGDIKYYDIYNGERKGCLKFCGYHVNGNRLYLFPYELRDIVCINMRNGVIQQKEWNFNILPEKVKNSTKSKFINTITINNIIYILCQQDSLFLKLSLNDFSGETINITETDESLKREAYERVLLDAAYENNVLYIMNFAGDIFSYNLETSIVRLFWSNKERRADGKCPYGKLLAYNGFLWQIPANSKDICRINIKTKESQNITKYPEGFKIIESKRADPWKWIGGETRNDALILYPYKANMLLICENIEKGLEGVKIDSPRDKNWEGYRLLQNREGYLYNEAEYSLYYFINIVIRDNDFYNELRAEYFRKLQSCTNGSCGENIWKYIKDNLEI